MAKFSDVQQKLYSGLKYHCLFDTSNFGVEVRRITSGPKRDFILEKL